jgi:hypothetical protein
MKLITGKKLIGRMLDNEIVYLRKNRYNTISQKTWEDLCDILLSYGFKTIENYKLENGFIEIRLNEDFILSSKIKVYW